jgi:hypothetical protein
MRLTSLLLIFGLLACSTPEEQQFDIFSETYDFNKNAWGWEAEFTDYPVDVTDQYGSYNWTAEYAEVFSNNIGSQMALRLSSDNVSEDVFMFIKKKVTGLKANTNYSLVFEVEMISNAQADQSVVLKAGASFVEPQKIVRDGWFELNLDKGTSLTSGKDLIILGELDGANPSPSYSNVDAPLRFTATTNNAGELWLIIGTESTYPGQNTVHYTKINVIFSAT